MIWVGMIAGFGLDFPRFLSRKPPAPVIVHLHALAFVGWLVYLTIQVALVLRLDIAAHRRLGMFGAVLAAVMVPLGLAAVLTTDARAQLLGQGRPQFLAVNFVDLFSFAVLVAAGIAMRNHAASHKRLMLLGTIALTDAGFSRIFSVPDPTTILPWFALYFYGPVLLIGSMAAWDLWRYRRVHPTIMLGGGLVLSGEFGATLLFFNPSWKAISTRIVEAWTYTG